MGCTDVGCQQLDGPERFQQPLGRGLGTSNCQFHRFWRYSKQVSGLRGLLGRLEFASVDVRRTLARDAKKT